MPHRLAWIVETDSSASAVVLSTLDPCPDFVVDLAFVDRKVLLLLVDYLAILLIQGVLIQILFDIDARDIDLLFNPLIVVPCLVLQLYILVRCLLHLVE